MHCDALNSLHIILMGINSFLQWFYGLYGFIFNYYFLWILVNGCSVEKSEDITVIIIFPANVFYGSTGQIFTPGALGCLMMGKIIFLNGKCIIGTLGDLGYIGKAVRNDLFLTAIVCGLFGLKRHRNWTICSPIQPFISLLFYRFWNDITFQPTVTSILYADLHHSHPTTFPARKDQSYFFPHFFVSLFCNTPPPSTSHFLPYTLTLHH